MPGCTAIAEWRFAGHTIRSCMSAWYISASFIWLYRGSETVSTEGRRRVWENIFVFLCQIMSNRVTCLRNEFRDRLPSGGGRRVVSFEKCDISRHSGTFTSVPRPAQGPTYC